MSAREDDQARELQNIKRQALLEQKADLAREKTKQANTRKQQIQGLKKINQKRKNFQETSKKTTELGLIGGILFGMFAMASVGIDMLPLFTGGTSSLVDWIFDAMLGIYGVVMILIITGDPFEALIGRKQAINFAGWLVESFFLGIDWLPFHILVAAVIWLDFKYNILDFKKNLSKISK